MTFRPARSDFIINKTKNLIIEAYCNILIFHRVEKHKVFIVHSFQSIFVPALIHQSQIEHLHERIRPFASDNHSVAQSLLELVVIVVVLFEDFSEGLEFLVFDQSVTFRIFAFRKDFASVGVLHGGVEDLTEQNIALIIDSQIHRRDFLSNIDGLDQQIHIIEMCKLVGSDSFLTLLEGNERVSHGVGQVREQLVDPLLSDSLPAFRVSEVDPSGSELVRNVFEAVERVFGIKVEVLELLDDDEHEHVNHHERREEDERNKVETRSHIVVVLSQLVHAEVPVLSS